MNSVLRMEADMLKQTRQAFLLLLVFTILTGIIYPLTITGVAQLIFSRQANGSLIYRDGKPVGSSLIGQPFTDPKYFWSRPSATSPMPYNAGSSSGSNLGPTNPDLGKAVAERVAALRKADPSGKKGTGPNYAQHPEGRAGKLDLSPSSPDDVPVPIDLATSSASGLDPHISPAAAEYQVGRVAKARGLDPETVRHLVARHTAGRTLGLLGEPRVNVVELNLDLDGVRP
jgi:potassium-transporting ATPase KdpC subunit